MTDIHRPIERPCPRCDGCGGCGRCSRCRHPEHPLRATCGVCEGAGWLIVGADGVTRPRRAGEGAER